MSKASLIVFTFLIPLFGIGQDYLVLDGYIDQAYARMYLTISEGINESGSYTSYQGYYSYTAQDKPIPLSIKEYSEDKLILINYGKPSPFTGETDDIIFTGELKDKQYTGIWTDGIRRLLFEFREADPETYSSLIRHKNSIKVPIELVDPEVFVEGSYDIEWYLPENEDANKGLIDVMGLHGFNDFDSFTQNILNEFEIDYMETILDIAESMKDDEVLYTSTWNYFHNISLKPILDNEQYLVMEYNAYDYTGGAHGYYYSLYYTYDKRLEKWLTQDDVFNMNEFAAIEFLIDQELRSQYQIGPSESLAEAENSIFIADRAHFPENFTFNKHGITFHYSVYELTPYAYGNFQITVSYEKLRPFLNPGFTY